MKPTNGIFMTGRLVREFESKGSGVYVSSIACDYSGYDSESDSKTGFFEITVYTNFDSPFVKFFKNQVESGNLKKGSAVSIIGSLSHRRWGSSGDGTRGERVSIIVDNLQYAGFSESPKGDAPAPSESNHEVSFSDPDF